MTYSIPETSAPTEAVPPRTVDVLGVPLALTSYAGTLDWMDEMAVTRERGYVCVANVHTVMESQEDERLRAAVLASSFSVPDGQPLVWALSLFGHVLPDRVYGPELMWQACSRAAATGKRFYLYGGRNQGALAQLALNLRRAHPGLKIVGGFSPPYRRLTREERAAVAADINSRDADVVWVGIGVPKQEKWMAEMRPLLKAPVLIGVGAAFDFHAGLVPQAPAWMQRLGLEWAFRLAREPRRLGRRYLRHNPRFLVWLTREWVRRRRRRDLATH